MPEAAEGQNDQCVCAGKTDEGRRDRAVKAASIFKNKYIYVIHRY